MRLPCGSLCSGGVIVPPKGWLKAIAETCKRLGILFLADEVITGFGRTGTMFACEHEGVEPDLMTIAKGLTSGYAPMGAVLMSDEIFNGIADGPNKAAVVGHGQTYSAHPVSAAVALEVIKIYEEGMLAHAQAIRLPVKVLDPTLASKLVKVGVNTPLVFVVND